MLRKIIIFFAAFLIGMIASEEFFSFDFEAIENSSKEINGDMSITSMDNTNDEVPHRPEHYKTLESEKVNGILKYVIGARVRSK